MRLIADYHTHTNYSHGKGSIRENVQAALKQGLKEIAISDHGPNSHSIVRLGVKNAQTFLEMKEEVARLQLQFPDIKILVGAEANIINLEGDLDIPTKILNQLDIVLVALHLLIKPATLRDGWYLIASNVAGRRLSRRIASEARKRNTETLIKAIEKNRVNIVAHPGYGLNIDTRKLARVCRENGVAMEINARHEGMTPEYVKIGLDEGVNFTVGSDAHKPEQVGQVQRAFQLIEIAGLPLTRVTNVI